MRDEAQGAADVEVVTFGCRLNSVDSEELAQKYQADGKTVVVNTCAVTKEAERQGLQMLRRGGLFVVARARALCPADEARTGAAARPESRAGA